MKHFLILPLFLMTAIVSVAQKGKPHFNHIALSVLDLNKSRIFYQDVLGLDTIPEPFHDGRHVWFGIGDNSHLHIIQNPAPLVVPSKKTHICFSIADINKLITVLGKNSIPYEDWLGKSSSITKRVDGIHQIYFQDPDGYWIEINDDYK
jgi:lactoylglutathione lyase